MVIERPEVARSMRAIHEALVTLDEPAGAALRQQFGLVSTRQTDLTILDGTAVDVRTSDLIRARMQADRSLQGAIGPSLPDLVARAAAVSGQAPDSPAVAEAVASWSSVDDADTQALLRVLVTVLPRDQAVWSPYNLWNEALVKEFFEGSRARRPVYLDLESEVVERLAREIGAEAGLSAVDPLRAFCGSVARTFELRPHGPSMLAKHVEAARDWAERMLARPPAPSLSGEHPPFVAALGLFSLAAEQMHAEGEIRATNYYGRLSDLLDVASSEGRTRVQNGFRRHGRILWDHLNAWLSAAQGARGFPTARSFDSRVHVGLPISQALVREAERSHLRELFVTYRLNPGQQFARPDMQAILEAWLPVSALTNLKALWNSGQDARRQIADAACAELEHWDGALPQPQPGSRREFQARMAATYFETPVPEFSLIVVVRDSGAVPLGQYNHPEGARSAGHPGAVTATAEPGGLIQLEAGPPGGTGNALMLAALQRPLDLRHESGGAEIARTPNPVLVMVHDETSALFVETARAELGRAHLLLVREDHVLEAQQALDQISRPGYKAVNGSAGVPDGWTLFVGVHIGALLPEPADRLLPLVPRSRTQVEFAGGLRISAGRWHSAQPPEAVAVSGAGQEFAVRLISEFTVAGGSVNSDLGVHTGEVRIPLDDLGLPDGNYRVLLSEAASGGAHLTSRALKLRSGTSSHLDPPLAASLKHGAASAFDGWSALSAAAEADGDGLTVSGAVVEGASCAPRPVPSETLPALLGTAVPVGDLDTLFQRVPGALREGLTEEFNDLLRRGLVILGTKGPELTDAGHRWADENLGRRPAQRPGAAPAGARALTDRSGADLDLIFDAVVVSGGGTWNVLEELVRHSASERWEPFEAARNLRSLGHIDIEVDRRTLRPRRWSVAPAALVLQPGGQSAFLAGWRNEELLSRVEGEARALGGVVFRHPRKGRPLLMQVYGLPIERLDELARGTGMAFIRGAPLQIAERLPSIREVYRQRPELHVPQGATFERFDFDLNQWTEVHGTPLAGAYLIKADMVHHAVLAEDGLRECDVMVAKYAGAAAVGRHIMSYDPAGETLTCLLGARPPGLYERALVLSSGELLHARSNGTAVYDGVPAEIAAWIARKLGPASWRA